MKPTDPSNWLLRLKILEGDITRQKVDAIVNAANSSLLGGGGVDGAIHHAAGPELLAECRTIGGCPTGEARITRGYKLPAKHVIHTVGPVWQDGQHHEDELLACCYRKSLELLVASGLRSIAFPAISTGAFGFPIDRAAEIAVATVKSVLEVESSIERVLMVCFGRQVYDAHSDALRQLLDDR